MRRTPEEVYDFLTDPNKFAPLLPDFQGLTVQDPTHFTVKVNVGISYIKGTAEVKMHLAEAERPKHAKYVGQGSVAGGSASVTAGFDLSATPTGTKVKWTVPFANRRRSARRQSRWASSSSFRACLPCW